MSPPDVQYFLPTVKEAPADAEAVSHKLSFARRSASGRGPVDLPAGGLARAPEREQIIRRS